MLTGNAVGILSFFIWVTKDLEEWRNIRIFAATKNN